MLFSSNEFNHNCRSTTLLISHNKHAECVKLSGRGDNSSAVEEAGEQLTGRIGVWSQLPSKRGALLWMTAIHPPSNITWALPPTQHSAAQYHIVSSDTVEPGGEGDGDNLRCDLEDGEGTTGDKQFVSTTVTWPDTGAVKAATFGSDLRENIVLCHAAASRAAPATGKRQTSSSLFL